MVQKFSDWLRAFDVSKAVILAIVAILGSWYDLRSQVELVKQEATLKWQIQDKLDGKQDKQLDEVKAEVRDGFRELKQVIRDQSQNARR